MHLHLHQKLKKLTIIEKGQRNEMIHRIYTMSFSVGFWMILIMLQNLISDSSLVIASAGFKSFGLLKLKNEENFRKKKIFTRGFDMIWNHL